MSETSKQVFEGVADTRSGWDFDMPVYMIEPVKRMGIGGSVYHTEGMVDDYLIDLSLGDERDESDDEDVNWGAIRRAMRNARDNGNAKASARWVYWRCEVVFPAGDRDDEEYWDQVIPGPMHYGPTLEAFPDV